MSRSLVSLAALTVLVGTAVPAAYAQDKDENKSPYKPFAELTKDAVVREGFFDTYEKPGHLYLAIPADRLNTEFLLYSEIARGIGADGLFGGTMLDIFEGKLVALERHGEQIFFVQLPHRFPADPSTPIGKAVDLTFGSSVVETAKIESLRDGDSAVVIDIHDWVVSDLSDVSQRVNRAVSTTPGRPGRATFDKGRSYLESVTAFPENLNIQAKLTFKPGEPVNFSSVPDSRYIPVSIHYTLAKLPDEPMTPREADDRTGYFLTVHKQFADDEKTFFKRYVNRWRLECDGPPDAQGLCDPKEQIVYYIDNTVPEVYRPAMMAGVEAWGAAFEAAGFRDAIRAEMLPADAAPGDIRYATLRWNVSDQPGYGAIGPSVVDPRSGEILDADILFEASMLLGFKRAWHSFVSPTAALTEMFEATPEELQALSQGGEMATLGPELSAQGALLRAALMTRGEIDPDEPVPMEYVNEALTWVTMHEVGHSLGLRHNFRSSADTPLDKLYDRDWAAERGVFSSVMEYPTTNISPAGMPQGHFYNPGVGSSDKWVIAYGYTPSPERAAEIAREAAMPGHAYGTDEDARGPGALDPTVNVYDLSDDPMGWGKQRADIIRGIWQTLPEYVLTDDLSYAEVTEAYQTLLSQYVRAVATGIKYIGGQYQHRDHMGDPGARPPFVAVSKAKQQEALAFLTEYALTERAFALPPEVFRQFGADRWSHWGNNNTFNGRIDYPLHEVVARLQGSLLNQITHPWVLARIRDAETKFGPAQVLTIPELMDGVSHAVWSEVWAAPGRNVPSTRRDLQRAHLDRLIEYVTDAPERTPADARSVARLQLQDLRDRLARRLAPPFSFDAYTLAHLTESRERIERALEAGLDIEN
jgi:hypothetical protein